jgi:hypothetical protein
LPIARSRQARDSSRTTPSNGAAFRGALSIIQPNEAAP